MARYGTRGEKSKETRQRVRQGSGKKEIERRVEWKVYEVKSDIVSLNIMLKNVSIGHCRRENETRGEIYVQIS